MSFPLPVRNRRRADDFTIGRLLGEGSLSTVHVAVERATGKRFALKVFDRKVLRSNRKDADVAMEEHCLRRANHPGVVKLHACFRDGEAAYLALELCPGGELWALARGSGCPERLARHYLAQLLEALAYLRDAGIVHRDLKAENVLLSAENRAKLVDFGSAKDLANPHVKGAGTVSFKRVLEDNVGTPNFMAPEVIRNKCSDFRSDVWSLGCTVFQVLSGAPPFGGGDLARVYSRALAARLAFPPGIPGEARDLISRMVVTEPGARLGAASVRELRAHAFFACSPGLGPCFEGAHRLAAPVPSLEELCLRAVGCRWASLGPRARAWAAARSGRLRREAEEALARFQEVAGILEEMPSCRSSSSS
mmetsp:Transcript_104410/g.336676  ORF Transcript_104410/g.336676 Transcript_104410/m.336676 type:complete len:364 (-) Transcript_104410:159-1250(-)